MLPVCGFDSGRNLGDLCPFTRIKISCGESSTMGIFTIGGPLFGEFIRGFSPAAIAYLKPWSICFLVAGTLGAGGLPWQLFFQAPPWSGLSS